MALSYAWNEYEWNDYLHKTRMSLCKIDHINVLISPIVDIKRESPEEVKKYCRDVTVESDNTEWFGCLIRDPSYSNEKKKLLGQNIENLYASRITNVIGVNTTINTKPPRNSFLGELRIKVEYKNRKNPDGTISYSVLQTAELQEPALSRTGREGFMYLDFWGDSESHLLGIENADMTALNLVTNVVSQMENTFREARKYCKENNLF